MSSLSESNQYKSDWEQQMMQMDPMNAIEVIMKQYGGEIKRFVYTYMKNSADTDDVTQEIFFTVYQKLHTFEQKSSLRTWIFSIAINKCKDHMKSWRYRNQKLLQKLQTTTALHEMMETPEELTIKQAHSTQLLDLCLNLPIQYREIIILYYFHDVPTREIGKILHLKEATVRTRLNRGREKLKKIYITTGGEDNG